MTNLPLLEVPVISLARDSCTYKAEGLLQSEAKELLVGKKISYFCSFGMIKNEKS